MSVEFDMGEIRELQRILDEKANEGRLNQQRDQAVERIAESVAQEVRTTAPYRTGALRGSVQTRFGPDGARVFSPKKQALFQEVGTSRHPPQPSFTPAAERGIDELVRLMDEIGAPW